MAIKNFKVENIDQSGLLTSKGFSLAKSCGPSTQGLIISTTINYLDNMIIAQNTQYNNSIFFQSYLSTSSLPSNNLGQYLYKILTKEADINEFTIECKNSEMYQQIYEFGSTMLGIDLNANEKEISSKLEEFSRRMNIRLNIYDAGKPLPLKITKNRQTDALVLTLFRDSAKNCFAVYIKDFSNLSIENENASQDFDQSYLNLNENFITISASILALNQLSEFVIPEDLRSQLHEIEQRLKSKSLTWPFLSQLAHTLSPDPCFKCSVRRVYKQASCGCSLCELCLKISISTASCSRCFVTFKPIDMNLIN